MVDISNFETVQDLQNYFNSLLDKKVQESCTATDIRLFALYYNQETGERFIKIDDLYTKFIEKYSDKQVKKSYFKEIIGKTWNILEMTVDNKHYVDMDHMILFNKDKRKRK